MIYFLYVFRRPYDMAETKINCAIVAAKRELSRAYNFEEWRKIIWRNNVFLVVISFTNYTPIIYINRKNIDKTKISINLLQLLQIITTANKKSWTLYVNSITVVTILCRLLLCTRTSCMRQALDFYLCYCINLEVFWDNIPMPV